MDRINFAGVNPQPEMTEEEYISWLNACIEENRKAQKAEEERQAEIARQQQEEKQRAQRWAKMNRSLKHVVFWFGILSLTFICSVYSLVSPEVQLAMGTVSMAMALFNLGIWWEQTIGRGGDKR